MTTTRPAIVISQIYFGGGGGSSTYKTDFVELHNTSSTPQTLTNWRVYYAAATSAFGSSNSFSATIPAGGYLLISGGSPGTAGVVVPSDIQVSGIAMGQSAGKFLLTRDSLPTAQRVACPSDPVIIDAMSWGTNNCNIWGTPSIPTQTQSLIRGPQPGNIGCAWTPNTGTDFSINTLATNPPRTLASGLINLCGSTTPTGPTTVTVTTNPAGITSALQGGTVQYVAAGSDANGPVATTYTWSVAPASVNPGSATINQSGLLTAGTAGDVVVKATAPNGVFATVTLTITAPVVATVEVAPAEATIFQNRTQQFSATAKDIQGNVINGQSFTWAIAPAGGQATTTSAGLVTGTLQGDVTVQATSTNGKVGIATLHILPPPPPPPTLIITEIMANPAKVADASGEWFEVYNPTNATVDLYHFKILSSTGSPPNLVTELHQITNHVTVGAKQFVVFANNTNTSTNGGITAAYQFTGITFSNGNTNEYLELQDSTDQTIDRVNWNTYDAGATNGQSMAVIDPDFDNLDITGANWEATAKDPSFLIGGVTGNDYGTPGTGDYGTHGPVASVSVSPNPAYVSTTGTVTLRATMKDATGASVRSPITWTTNNPSVINLNATTGVAQGVAAGDAVVTATSANGVQGSTVVHVLAPGTPAYIEISLDASVPAGFVKRAFYTLKDPDGNSITSPQTVTWSTSDPNLATIDSKGYVYTKQAGVVQIIATSGVASGSKPYTILPGSVATSAVYRNHIEFGVPTDADNTDDQIIQRTQFVSSWNPNRGGPNWVSWDLNATHFGNAPRCDCFTADPLTTGYVTSDQDYVGSGYSRGHMVQSESRTTTDQENATTFYMSNMLPQAQSNNAGPWLDFENFANNLARLSGKEVYVVAGGEYPSNPQTLNSLGNVQIPDYTWKVLIAVPAGKGLADVKSESDLQVYAVRMPNLLSTAANKGTDWTSYQTTVDDIEARTGYDVFKLLPDKIEIAVESGTHAPVARSTVPTDANVGDAVSFSGSTSSDADNQQLTYAWSFGDNTTAAGVSATHTYATAGNFQVRLIVTDPLQIADTVVKTIHIKDTTAPVVTVAVTGTLGSNDWYTSDVHVVWTTSDPESGIATSTGCSTVDVANDTNGVTFTCVAKNGDGMETTQSVTVKRDASIPDVTETITGTAGKNGWYTGASVSVTWSGSDALSGIIGPDCPATTITADTQGQDVTCTVTNGAGLTATKKVTVKYDNTVPTLTPVVTGTLGTNGWYKSNVQVAWNGGDVTSGIIGPDCPVETLSTDSNGTTYSCTVENGAGLTKTVTQTVKRDATVPAVTYANNLGVYTVSDMVNITCSASDALSGVASTTCADISAPAYTLLVGNNSYSANATDNAGNVGSGSTSFTVEVGTLSLSKLVTAWSKNAGQATSLNQKLDAIQQAIDNGNANAKAGEVSAFINAVEAQRNKAFTNAQADLLIRLVKLL